MGKIIEILKDYPKFWHGRVFYKDGGRICKYPFIQFTITCMMGVILTLILIEYVPGLGF